jgi:hypothetical protein
MTGGLRLRRVSHPVASVHGRAFAVCRPSPWLADAPQWWENNLVDFTDPRVVRRVEHGPCHSGRVFVYLVA